VTPDPAPPGAPRDALGDWLVATLARLAPEFPGPIAGDTGLAEDGLGLDSLTLADLIAEIVERWQVPIREVDVSPEVFGTVGRLHRFLAARLAGREP
jgi:acyl carrier protein